VANVDKHRRQSTEENTKGARSVGDPLLALESYARQCKPDSVAGALPVIENSPVDLPRHEIHTSLAREPTSYLGVCTLFMAIGEKGASRITYAAGYYAL